jgi:hypothetical protein
MAGIFNVQHDDKEAFLKDSVKVDLEDVMVFDRSPNYAEVLEK